MFKNFLKIRNKKRTVQGTALITALLVMGVLTAISLSVSALIVREISITRLALDAGKAYYAAESGMEVALLKLSKNPMGDFGSEDDDFSIGDMASVNYKIENTSTTYPVINEEMTSDNAEAYYSYLDVNESVTIPLFTVDGEGNEKPVTEFFVQFFPNFNPEELIFGSGKVQGWDVLRWKVYGIVPDGKNNKGKTESINDFTSFASVTVQKSDDEEDEVVGLTGAKMPSWFGTGDNAKCTGFGEAYGIKCAQYGGVGVVATVLEDGQTIYQGTCEQFQAREHYYYDDSERMDVVDCYDIQTFLKDHTNNYLVLTNLMNPSVLSDALDYDERAVKSRLYYRVVTTELMPREFAEITSSAEVGDSRITLDMLRKRDSFMPIFNFALYHNAGAN